MQMPAFEKHVWAEIDLEALRHNFRAVKARAGALPLCAVVKADSYGHGAVQCARVFAEEGAAWLAVSCLTEAVQLRKAGQTLPILILGHVQPAYAAALIQNDITVACYSLAQARALSEAAVAAGGRVLHRTGEEPFRCCRKGRRQSKDPPQGRYRHGPHRLCPAHRF